jgi:nicotinate-nucleotide pyrophosphorylase (carboxylating)
MNAQDISVHVNDNVARALAEDIGSGDLTASLIDPARQATATIVCREAAVICGQPWVMEVLRRVAPTAQAQWRVADGQRCQPGQTVVQISGAARELLSAERTCLNFLQTLSAVATQTARYVAAVQGTKAAIVDTRKTLPGLRVAEKYAVRCGGGVNHRMGLFDAVLIKENHIAAAGGLTAAFTAAQAVAAQAAFIEVEVETLTQLEEALRAGVTMILLDNMPLDMLHQAVALTQDRAVLEISGGVNLESVRALAETGVDRISIGALTKDIKAVDFSMRFQDRPVE